MGIIEIVLIGIGLSADAFSVTVADVFANARMPFAERISMPVAFGVFQGIMPILGYYLGFLAAGLIERYAGIVSLIILGAIGAKMIWDGCHSDGMWDKEGHLTIRLLLLQAVATSIDAFAVGVSFAAQVVNIWIASVIIACCTFLCCIVALFIGRKLGTLIGRYAQVIGGIVLVLIGLKAMFF